MQHSKNGVLLSSFALVMISSVVLAQGTGSAVPDTTNAQFAGSSFSNWIAVVLIMGAIGGFIYELISLQGNIERVHKTEDTETPEAGFPYAIAKYLFDMGYVGRMIIGAGAAFLVGVILAPESLLELAAMSLIAGSAGTSIFGALQDKLLNALKNMEIDQMKQVISNSVSEMDELLIAIEKLKAGINSGELAPVHARVITDELNSLSGRLEGLKISTNNEIQRH